MATKVLSMLAVLTIALGGCGGSGEPSGGATAPTAVDLPEDVSIPTQEEADAEAAIEITEENAEAVLEQLAREVEEDLGEER